VEIRAPFDGVIMERNATLGDIVDTNDDLFKIADLNRLAVMVNAYEENLTDLESLPQDARRWTIRVKAQPNSPGVAGTFDTIGSVIDPTQHTVTVTGWVDNRDGHLRVGQFVTATIDLPALNDEVVIPKSALVEESDHAIVFVADDPRATRVERRTVSVARRARDLIYLYSKPRGMAALAGVKPISVGDLVVISGVVELSGALQDNLLALPPDESNPP
jgi:cobalt-zinc-cadmium efflux system membrane fusion protein